MLKPKFRVWNYVKKYISLENWVCIDNQSDTLNPKITMIIDVDIIICVLVYFFFKYFNR